MISKLIPLPIPYSSICSPSHIRNTVPQVITSTAMICQPKYKPVASALRKFGLMLP